MANAKHLYIQICIVLLTFIIPSSVGLPRKYERLTNFLIFACQNSCKNGQCNLVGKPIKLPFTVKCNCFQGYKGYYCDEPVCNTPCKQGKCVFVGSNQICRCNRGFSGTTCNDVDWNIILGFIDTSAFETDATNKVKVLVERRAPECAKNFVCQNGGFCTKISNGVGCQCVAPFTGTFCQDRCVKACQNNGNCYLHQETPTCSCPWGYNGEFCENTL